MQHTALSSARCWSMDRCCFVAIHLLVLQTTPPREMSANTHYWRRLEPLPEFSKFDSILPPTSTLLPPSSPPIPGQRLWIVSYRFLLQNEILLRNTLFGNGHRSSADPVLVFTFGDNLYLNMLSSQGRETARKSLITACKMNAGVPTAQSQAAEGLAPSHIFEDGSSIIVR